MHPPPVIIEVEPLHEGSTVEVVELVATDLASWRAMSVVPQEGIAVQLIPSRGWLPADRETIRTPAMVIAVGDLRAAEGEAAVIRARRPNALAVALVAVDGLETSSLLRIERSFDAVMPVVVPRTAEAEPALADALACLTGFATANTVSLPVDEAYNFFVDGGQLSWARARGDEIATMTTQAARAARRRKAAPNIRVLLHVETTAKDYLADLERAAIALRQVVDVGELLPVLSISDSVSKSVSLVVAAFGGTSTATR
jgi:hypothetical protein